MNESYYAFMIALELTGIAYCNFVRCRMITVPTKTPPPLHDHTAKSSWELYFGGRVDRLKPKTVMFISIAAEAGVVHEGDLLHKTALNGTEDPANPFLEGIGGLDLDGAAVGSGIVGTSRMAAGGSTANPAPYAMEPQSDLRVQSRRVH